MRDYFPWIADGFRQSSSSPHYYHILNYNALSKIQNKIMSRVDTFTIIRKHTKNKVRTSLIISSLEFVNNKNLLSYVCFPIIVKVSSVALSFGSFTIFYSCILLSVYAKLRKLSVFHRFFLTLYYLSCVLVYQEIFKNKLREHDFFSVSCMKTTIN